MRQFSQLGFQVRQRLAAALDELAQHGKLRGRFLGVRSIQRPAQLRQRIQADTRLEGRPYEAQPVQGSIVEQAVAARGARHGPGGTRRCFSKVLDSVLSSGRTIMFSMDLAKENLCLSRKKAAAPCLLVGWPPFLRRPAAWGRWCWSCWDSAALG